MTSSSTHARQTGRVDLRLRQGLRRWWQLRAAPSETHRMTQRNVYILPTRAGLMFTVTVATLLLASINYQLNLGYLLTFLLAGSGVVSMHWTHNTLRGLSLHLKPVASVFAGDPARIEVVVSAPPTDRQPRYGIGIVINADGDEKPTWIDVPAGGRLTTQLTFATTTRGLQALPRLTVQTRFPLGLFRAWTIWRPAASCLVYPRPEADPPPLPLAQSSGSSSAPARVGGSGGDSDGIRGYHRGDPLRNIVWRKAAKLLDVGGDLLSRDTTPPGVRMLWLDWAACAPLPAEQRLSRLTAWVLAADRLGARYGLRLPERSIAPEQGELHRRNCLEALASWR